MSDRDPLPEQPLPERNLSMIRVRNRIDNWKSAWGKPPDVREGVAVRDQWGMWSTLSETGGHSYLKDETFWCNYELVREGA